MFKRKFISKVKSDLYDRIEVFELEIESVDCQLPLFQSSRFARNCSMLLIIGVLDLKTILRTKIVGQTKTNVYSLPSAKPVIILKFLLPQKAYEEIFAQAIADMREEYFEALADNRPKHARWIHLRGNLNLILVVGLYLTAAFVDRGMKIYKSFSSP